MHIGLGLHQAQATTGLGAAQRTLLMGLRQITTEHQLTVFATPDDLELIPNSARIHRYPIGGSEDLCTGIEGDELDVFHGLSYLAPFTADCPTVVTVPDTMMLRNVDKLRDMTAGLRVLSRCARAADRVITVSEYSRHTIHRDLGIPEERISVVHNGIPIDQFQRRDGATARQRLDTIGITPPYVLHVGGTLPRKNLATLVAAFDLVVHEIGNPLTLVIVNGVGDAGLRDGIASILEYHPTTGAGHWDGAAYRGEHVLVTGAVDVETLASLYSHAAVFCYPSLEEGFGLPPNEAMACGTPVIAADTSCLPEVLGDAAILTGPRDKRRLARAILRVLRDNELASRLRARGLERAEGYTAAEMARATFSIYDSVRTQCYRALDSPGICTETVTRGRGEP